MQVLIHRDSRPWQLQVWVSFLVAVFLCAVGLAYLPGRDLDRAFMVMGYFFCLSAAFVLAKYVRDHEKTLASLNASGQNVVVLARAGQDLGKYGVRYSHLGLAYQQSDDQGGRTWRVLHKLNDCGTSDSAIYRQGLGEFFLDDLWRFEAAWLPLAPEAQTRLLSLLQDPGRAVSLHHKPYSIVSYAWGRQYQQSNQWAIETLAAAMEPGVNSRERAQAWLQFKGYEPAVLRIGPLTRLGGRVSAANVAFDDHPNDKRFSDRIETVTVDSVFDWLSRAQLAPPGVAPTIVKL